MRAHRRLLRFLRRWKLVDEARGLTCHYQGQLVRQVYHAWDAVRNAAGAPKDTPHILRDTPATLMQAGVDIWEASGYLGMCTDVLTRVYGHHSPAIQENAPTLRPRNA